MYDPPPVVHRTKASVAESFIYANWLRVRFEQWGAHDSRCDKHPAAQQAIALSMKDGAPQNSIGHLSRTPSHA